MIAPAHPPRIRPSKCTNTPLGPPCSPMLAPLDGYLFDGTPTTCSTSVFRANPFTVNDIPFQTISETTVDGQHGPLMYPPVLVEFSLWLDPAMPSLPVTPTTLYLCDPPSHASRKRSRSGISPPLLSTSSSTSFRVSSPNSPPISPWMPEPQTVFTPPSPPRLVLDRAHCTSVLPLALQPSPDAHPFDRRTNTGLGLPPSLTSRKNACQLRSCPPFDNPDNPGPSRSNMILPLPASFLTFLDHFGTSSSHQIERDSEWPYHPCEWRGLPGPKFLLSPV